MSAAPAFASVGEAIEMARAALGYLAAPRRHHRAANKDKTKVLHSHGPPVRPG